MAHVGYELGIIVWVYKMAESLVESLASETEREPAFSPRGQGFLAVCYFTFGSQVESGVADVNPGKSES